MRPFDPRLLSYARSARTPILATATLGTLIALTVITQALLISSTLSPVIDGQHTLSDALPLIALLALLVCIRGLLTAARETVAQRSADHAIRDLRAAVLSASEELGPRWRALHGTHTATLVTRGLDDLGPYFVKFLPQLILTCTATPLALAVMIYLDPWSGLISALVVPLIPIFMILIGRFTQESSHAKLKAMEQLSAQLLDLMAGLPTLRGLGRHAGPSAHLKKLGADNTQATMATLRVAFLSGAVLEFLATICVALVAVEVGMRLVYGNITLSSGLAVIMLAPEVFEPLRQVGAQFHASANGVAAANAAFEIIETPRPHTSRPQHAHALAAPDPATTAIKIDALSVAARQTWAPADLNATISPGTLTVLVGPSGAGKTTTILTILGLLPPTRGRILLTPIEGAPDHSSPIDLADLDLADWWSHISWVPQHPTITPGTIVDHFSRSAPDDRLLAAAAQTGFDQVVATLPLGWDTRIGLGGQGLSLGQRQRLALTRALVDNTPIVILDEPTAHLDALSQDDIARTLSALKSQGKTVLVIAHRPALAALADHTLTIESRRATDAELRDYPILAQVPDTAQAFDCTLPELLDSSMLCDTTGRGE